MPLLKKDDARSILWQRGVLSWKLHKGQRLIDSAFGAVNRKLFVANCARRYGKTYWACVKAIEFALTCENPMPRVKYASATRLDLKEFVIPAFEQILRDCPDDIAPIWRATESKYIFPHNGAEIQLIGLDKRPDGGRGNYCDLYIFEEAGFINKLSYLYGSVVLPMTLRRKGAKIIMISTPSITPAHEFQLFCERAQKQKAYIELNIMNNPMLTQKDIEDAHAECLDESEWLREYMCQFVVDKNRAVIPEWSDDLIAEVPRPRYFKHLHRYTCMDLGVKIDLTALVFGFYDPKTRLLIVEEEAEINGPQMTTITLRDLVKVKESSLWQDEKVHKRVSDSDNPLLIQDLGQLHGVHFVPTGKDELAAMINEVRVFVKAKRLRVNPKCMKLIGCLRYAIWNNKRKALDRSQLYGHFDHLMALVYLIRNLDQVTDPVPDVLNPNSDLMHMRPKKKKANESWKRIFNLK